MGDIFDSPEYLRKEMLKFREMMGNKKDWELSDDSINRKIDLAFKGLFHIYLKTKNKTDVDEMYMDAIIVEFPKRKYYVEIEDLNKI